MRLGAPRLLRDAKSRNVGVLWFSVVALLAFGKRGSSPNSSDRAKQNPRPVFTVVYLKP